MARHDLLKGRKRLASILNCFLLLICISHATLANDPTAGDTSSSHYQEEEHFSVDETKHRLEILPESAGTVVKRVNETLNLTCQVVKESGPFLKFLLEWHLPQSFNNRINRQITNNPRAVNTLQLIITKLQESDSGKYRCVARDDKSVVLQHSLEISVLPRKGSCNNGMFECSSKACIPQRYKCDGSPDCNDGSDEAKEICGESPCDGKLHCDDGRCISKKYCCDKYYDANCTATYEIPCCGKLLNFLTPDFPLQTHHQFHEIGFLQSTMYTIIGCAVAFVLIVTFTVIAVCRVHMRRSALANAYAAYRTDARVWSDLDSYIASSNGRWSRGLLRAGDLSRSPGLVLNSFSGDPGLGHGPNTSLLVTYNINNGVQLMGRPIEPPPYEEVAAAGHSNSHGRTDEPPPPYVSRENLSQQIPEGTGHWSARNPAGNSSPFLSAIFSLLVNNSQPIVVPAPPSSSNQPSVVVVPVPAPAAVVERVEEDNNNGDINGNNTGQVWVHPNSNRDQMQPVEPEEAEADDNIGGQDDGADVPLNPAPPSRSSE